MNSKIYDAVKNAPVKIRGAILAEFFRGESPTRIPVGVTADVPGLGRCSSMIVDARLGEQLLKVDCESVSEIPFMNQVRLLDRATGWQWIGNLGASMSNVSYPRMTWLSPLNHRDAFFHLTVPGIGVSQRSFLRSNALILSGLSLTKSMSKQTRTVRFNFLALILCAVCGRTSPLTRQRGQR